MHDLFFVLISVVLSICVIAGVNIYWRRYRQARKRKAKSLDLEIPASPLRLCVDCKYFAREPSLLVQHTLCKHPQSKNKGELDLVSGETSKDSWHYASNMRRPYDDLCHPEGRLFEPRERDR